MSTDNTHVQQVVAEVYADLTEATKDFTREDLIHQISILQQNAEAQRFLHEQQKHLIASQAELVENYSEEIVETDQVVDRQAQMLTVYASFCNYWMNLQTQPGSRSRSTQIVVDELVGEIMDLDAYTFFTAEEISDDED